MPAGSAAGSKVMVTVMGGLNLAPSGPKSKGKTTVPFGGGLGVVVVSGAAVRLVSGCPLAVCSLVPCGIVKEALPSAVVTLELIRAVPVVSTTTPVGEVKPVNGRPGAPPPPPDAVTVTVWEMEDEPATLVAVKVTV